MNKYLQILDRAWIAHNNPRKVNAPTIISTFAGAGGSSLGYSMAGYHELLAIEWDDNAVETFRLNFPDTQIYHGDISELTTAECLQLAGIEPGELDIFDGSGPEKVRLSRISESTWEEWWKLCKSRRITFSI